MLARWCTEFNSNFSCAIHGFALRWEISDASNDPLGPNVTAALDDHPGPKHKLLIAAQSQPNPRGAGLLPGPRDGGVFPYPPRKRVNARSTSRAYVQVSQVASVPVTSPSSPCPKQ
jgi:hypothetical protein